MGLLHHMGPNGLYMTVRTCLTQLQPEDPWSFCSCSYVLDAPPSVSPTIKLRWYGRGKESLMLYSNIPPPACEPWLLTLPAPAQARPCLRTQQTLVRVEYAQQKITWRGELNPRPQLWYHARCPPSASPTIKSRWYRKGEGSLMP
jgi:hypothetical protein